MHDCVRALFTWQCVSGGTSLDPVADTGMREIAAVGNGQDDVHVARLVL